MALDAATLALAASELKTTLTDAKIAKIFEPTRDELVISLRTRTETFSLLLSARSGSARVCLTQESFENPETPPSFCMLMRKHLSGGRTRTETFSLLLSARSGSARVCLTQESFENPETPPSFCMLMRKHLSGGRLLDVRMEPGDRIVYFEFLCTNEMGDLVHNILCAELMGRYSNLVLVQDGKILDALKRVDFEDSEVRQLLPGGDLVHNILCAELMGRYSNLVLVQDGKILDALKRVDFEDSEVRQLLPGLPYTVPPKPARPDFLSVSAASIVAAACTRELPVADALNKTAAGVGPVVCREAAWRAFAGEELLASALTEPQRQQLMQAIDQLKAEHEAGGTPCSIAAPDGRPVDYPFLVPQQYGEAYQVRRWPSFSALLDGYYAEKDRAERLRTKSKELHKAVHNMYDRALRKQAARRDELAASGKSEKLRLYGELLSATAPVRRAAFGQPLHGTEGDVQHHRAQLVR